MNLSTEIINNVIIFHDGSRKFVTKEQADFLLKASCTEAKSVTTQKLGLITFSAIAKIISLKDFYDQYPDERPEPLKEVRIQDRPGYKSLEEEILSSESRRNSAVRGLQQYIDEAEARGENPTNAKDILKGWQNKTINKISSNKNYYQKTVEKYKDRVRNESEEAHYQHALKKLQEFNVFA